MVIFDFISGCFQVVGYGPAGAPVTKRTHSFHVSDLTPGQDYKFRVTAVNDEGDSEPLETESAIKAKNPYGKYPTRLLASTAWRAFHL